MCGKSSKQMDKDDVWWDNINFYNGDIRWEDNRYYNYGSNRLGAHGHALGSFLFVLEKLINMDGFTRLTNGHLAHKLTELLVTSYTKIQMLWSDGLLFALMANITGNFENFSSEILQHAS